MRPLSDQASIRIKDLPTAERPRERLRECGADSLRNSELLAIILRTGSKGFSAVAIAEQLLQKFGTLDKLSRASLDDLQKVRGLGRDKAVAIKSAFTLAQRLAREIRHDSPPLDSPAAVADLLREEYRIRDVETFYVLLLNARNRLIRAERVSMGLLDQLLVHPREVFRHAIAANAASVILAHNHPSGDPTPSDADVTATRDLVRAGQVLKIKVLDHVIIGTPSNERPRDYVSLREIGVIHE